jgi:glycosyltransferase involved in cell wall biosynthesis
VRFVIVGEGEERRALEAQARASGVADRILMPGHIAHEPGLPWIFDIAVLTSREEGFPNSVVEAMAAGRPVVATAVGGVPDAVVEGETGYMIAPGDDRHLAQSIERLLRDRALRERLGAAAVERARAAWHVDIVMGALTALYAELARQH